jgi:CheY-like chemotaxis protein
MPLLDTLDQKSGQLSASVAKHRGTDPAASTYAGTSTFQRLRTALEPQSESRMTSVNRPGRHEPRVAILLVEDEETLRNAVVQILQKKGFEVLAAPDGTAAVDQLRAHGERLTVLMLDVTLPGLPSRNVLEEARRIRPGITVLLTSAFTQDVAESSFKGLQVDSFIQKPFRLALLIELLESVLTNN